MERRQFLRYLLVAYAFVILASTKVAVSDPTMNITNITIEAGNVTRVDMLSDQNSLIWQGLYGTLSGDLILDDASGNTMYDWTVVNAKGEVMASRSVITDWATINCTNQTQIYDEEYRLSIPNISTESINRTFTNNTHPAFDIGTKTISNCRSTLTDNSTDNQVVFWNVLLNADADTTVYVALIDDDTVGFNGDVIDYQLLVPTNRSSGFAVYQIYMELT